MYEEIMRN